MLVSTDPRTRSIRHQHMPKTNWGPKLHTCHIRSGRVRPPMQRHYTGCGKCRCSQTSYSIVSLRTFMFFKWSHEWFEIRLLICKTVEHQVLVLFGEGGEIMFAISRCIFMIENNVAWVTSRNMLKRTRGITLQFKYLFSWFAEHMRKWAAMTHELWQDYKI